MNKSNKDCKSMWLETTDSKILHTGFVDFVKNYQQRSTVEVCVEPKLDTEGPKSSKISSPVKVSKSNLSLKSIPPPAISGTNCGVDDAGFDRFLDEWTANASNEARKHWFRMSKRDRAMYAPKISNTSVSSSAKRLYFGKVSSGAIRRACEKVCVNLVKGYNRKSKGPQPKGYLSKPRYVMKRWKLMGDKVCPKPKSEGGRKSKSLP